eukprot:SM000007S20831  [mRNA]  locus=s7:401036:402272:- [translate_table: standard]
MRELVRSLHHHAASTILCDLRHGNTRFQLQLECSHVAFRLLYLSTRLSCHYLQFGGGHKAQSWGKTQKHALSQGLASDLSMRLISGRYHFPCRIESKSCQDEAEQARPKTMGPTTPICCEALAFHRRMLVSSLPDRIYVASPLKRTLKTLHSQHHKGHIRGQSFSSKCNFKQLLHICAEDASEHSNLHGELQCLRTAASAWYDRPPGCGPHCMERCAPGHHNTIVAYLRDAAAHARNKIVEATDLALATCKGDKTFLCKDEGARCELTYTADT